MVIARTPDVREDKKGSDVGGIQTTSSGPSNRCSGLGSTVHHMAYVSINRENAPHVSSPKAIYAMCSVSKSYPVGEVEVTALRSVDLELYDGEFVVLLGPSGSGKSTLLNILGGLDVPTSGEVYFRDRLLTAANDATLTQFRREHVGFVFQFYNLIPSLTAAENVALVTELSSQAMHPHDALGMVGLAHRIDHFPAQLSGGRTAAGGDRPCHCQASGSAAVR